MKNGAKKSLLDHARHITTHRQHELLDEAMIETLLSLVTDVEPQHCARLFRVHDDGHKRFCVLTAWTEAGKIHCDEIDYATDQVPEQMSKALSELSDVSAVREIEGLQRHAVWLPIHHGKERLGCIELSMPTPLTPDQLHLIDGVRGLYANYLSLLNYSQIDTLTRLLNRKTFDESLARMLDEAMTQQPMDSVPHERRGGAKAHTNWLAVMDIDHFKRINDNFGHIFGDEVLILVANLMREIFRRRDKLFRFGGEEFVVLLRDTDSEGAPRIFDRLRAAVERYAFPQVGKVTISIGFTQVRRNDNPAALLGRADEALYHAKRNGRNQVAHYDELELAGQVQHAAVANTEFDLF
jgi:diguanylate cyclase (GGDEF)-like protein